MAVDLNDGGQDDLEEHVSGRSQCRWPRCCARVQAWNFECVTQKKRPDAVIGYMTLHARYDYLEFITRTAVVWGYTPFRQASGVQVGA